MKKSIMLLLATVLSAMSLIGCGDKDAPGDATELAFKKNGEVVHTIVEDFSEGYYSLDELTSEIRSQIDGYNAAAGADSVKLDSAQVEDGIITVVMTFKKAEDYTAFYRQALFCGTVKEAFDAGYDLNITLNSVKEEGTVITKQDILEMGERHVIVAREAIRMKPFGEILYVTDDVALSESGKEAVSSDGEELSYIIFK